MGLAGLSIALLMNFLSSSLESPQQDRGLEAVHQCRVSKLRAYGSGLGLHVALSFESVACLSFAGRPLDVSTDPDRCSEFDRKKRPAY